MKRKCDIQGKRYNFLQKLCILIKHSLSLNSYKYLRERKQQHAATFFIQNVYLRQAQTSSEKIKNANCQVVATVYDFTI